MIKEVDQVFNNFWREIVCNGDGSLNEEQVKKELYDFYVAMENVPKVYCHITGNTLSKINYTASAVISCYEEHVQRLINEAIDDYKESVGEG